MNRGTDPTCSVIVAGLSLIFAAGAFAGPLTPPAGPVTATSKPLNEIEPRIAINAANTPGDNDATPSLFKITASGSYYLTANISAVSARSGIEIAASGVTLDLNGFSIAGFGGHTGIIVTNAAVSRIVIRNGSVVNFLQGGIDANVAGVEIDHVSVETCGEIGIRTGDHARITDCSASDCHTNAVGVYTGFGSIISGCTASGNASHGISTQGGCTVSRCSAYANTRYGILCNHSCTLSNCSAYDNTELGIAANIGSTLSNCSASQNGSFGILLSEGCTIADSSAASNSGGGISASDGCTISRCSAVSNAGNGIEIDINTGATVEGCSVRANTLDGIFCASGCTIRDNTCRANGSGGDGAGIHATGFDNRIEGNNCSSADRGIDVDGAGNIIIRNTCSGNTVNWTIVAGNSFLVVQATVTSSNFSGNAGGGGQGSTDPNANFTY